MHEGLALTQNTSNQPASFALLSTEAHCPLCRGALVQLEETRFLFTRCAGCGASWLDMSGWQRVDEGMLTVFEKAFLEHRFDGGARPAQGSAFREAAHETNKRPQCPVCEVALARHRVVDANADVHVCREHGVLLPQATIHPVWQSREVSAMVAPKQQLAQQREEAKEPLPGRSLLMVGGAIYLVSMCLPSLKFSIIGEAKTMYGVHCALFGLPFYPSNLMVLLMLPLARSLKGVYGWITTVVMFGTGIAAFAMGADNHFKDLEVGFFVWASSFFVLGLGALVATISQRNRWS